MYFDFLLGSKKENKIDSEASLGDEQPLKIRRQMIERRSFSKKLYTGISRRMIIDRRS